MTASLPGWLVCDLSEGILRREATRTAALSWIRGYFLIGDAPVRRYQYGPSCYEYVFSGNDSIFLCREDQALRQGWGPDQPPLYPDPEDSYLLDFSAEQSRHADGDTNAVQ
jgi:hypothetical protein